MDKSKFEAQGKMFEVGNEMEWSKWHKELPAIPFKEGWKVKIVPPFGGAIVRFLVFNNDESKQASIYFDAYNLLGCGGKPYWEVYPYQNDVGRVPMNDVDGLLEMISEAID